MRIAPRKAILLFVVCCVSACASSEDQAPPPANPAPVTLTEQPSFSQIGFASWYGRNHQDKATANGEQFDMAAMTAAHRALPFNSIARVTNLRTGRTIKVRINDRGPYMRNRVIDLSAAAGRQLGIRGVGRVKVEVFASDQRSPAVNTAERTAQP
jgi:rare lipoprotein A